MQTERLASKAGTIASLPMCLLLSIFFFLPWLNVTCAGQKVADASGLQLSIGKIGTVAGASGDDESSPRSSPSPSSSAGPKKDPKARPWFFLALAIPLVLLVLGVMSLAGRVSGPAASGALLVLGAAGFVILLLALGVDYGAEMAAPDAKPPQSASNSPADAMGEVMAQGMRGMQDQMSKQVQIKTEATGILIFSIVLQALVACCGLLNRFGPRLLAMTAQVQPPPPAPPVPPPGSP